MRFGPAVHEPVPVVLRYPVAWLGPAMYAVPLGATNIIGKYGTDATPPVSARQVPSPFTPPALQTSGSVLSAPAVSPPEMVSTSPVARVRLVGYQRPFRMFGAACHVLVLPS